MTERIEPFEMADPAARSAFAKRLDAAFTVLVDLNDHESVARAARSAGGEVLSLSDLPGAPGFYDPLTFPTRQHQTTRTANPNQD